MDKKDSNLSLTTYGIPDLSRIPLLLGQQIIQKLANQPKKRPHTHQFSYRVSFGIK